MIVRIDFKQVGNHWYPCLHHQKVNHLRLDQKVERCLSRLDTDKNGLVSIYLNNQCNYINDRGIVQFVEQDISRYFITNDDFLINVYIDDHHFFVSSNLYLLIENEYNLNLHENVYKIEL